MNAAGHSVILVMQPIVPFCIANQKTYKAVHQRSELNLDFRTNRITPAARVRMHWVINAVSTAPAPASNFSALEYWQL